MFNVHEEANFKHKSSRAWVGYIIVLVVLVVYVGGWVGLVYALKTEVPVTVVEGNSMVPTLRNGDIVFLKKVSVEELINDYKNGKRDIIVFYSPGGTRIIHKIYSLVYDEEGNFVGFRTKGDNNQTPDPWIVTSEDIIGKVVWGPIPLLGTVILFTKTPLGFFLVSVIIALLVVWIILSELKLRLTKFFP